ncbi:MAG: HIT family protein [Alphaproteobacteria bacterium]
MFAIHPRLAADTVAVLEWRLCHVLLMNDRTFPWLILVPARNNVAEIHHLDAPERSLLVEEIARASRVLLDMTRADKINTAALGNVVPQLHVHVIARFQHDPAWPKPVWGAQPPSPYDRDELSEMLARLRRRLSA